MPSISLVTRREIFDRLSGGRYDWAGRLQEDEFLSRLYDLHGLPSTDHRFNSAASDIWQHRVSWSDWDNDWVFYDSRFNLLHCSDQEFLRFLSETVHPVVRVDENEAREIVALYNDQLRRDGWELFESGQISGRPLYSARDFTAEVAEVFEEPTGWPKVDRQMGEVRFRLRQASTEEHFQSVGHMCREVLISLAQAVYDAERYPTTDGVEPSPADAKRMLEAYIRVELAGSGNADARKHAKASFDLANALQHNRSAIFRDAALCAEATLSVVRIIAIVSGRREGPVLSQ